MHPRTGDIDDSESRSVAVEGNLVRAARKRDLALQCHTRKRVNIHYTTLARDHQSLP